MKKISELDKQIKEMKEELERITADPELREMYYQREKDLRDVLSLAKANLEEGYEKGIKEKAKEIVINMNKKNIDIETISEIVNLSKEEIEKIIKENK